MSNAIIFSDIHIHAHKNSQDRLNDCLKVFEWVFHQARETDSKRIFFLGDMFHDRQKMHIPTYNKTFEILDKNRDIEFWAILGNHDLWYYENTEISSVYPFSALPNLHIINQPCTHTFEGTSIDFLPFTHNPLKVIKEEFQKKSDMLFSHIAVDKAILNFGHRTKSEVSVEIDSDMVPVSADSFSGWKRVFLGHYHGMQKIGKNIEYVGSPLQLSFGEANCKKRIILMEIETLKTKDIYNDFSPEHFILSEDEVPEELGNNFYKIVVENMNSMEFLDKKNDIKKNSPNAIVTFTPENKFSNEDMTEKVKKFKTMEGDILTRFIKSCETTLDQDKLFKIGQEICFNEN